MMAMPEANVHENNCTVLWKYDVRLAGEFLVVHPIAKSQMP